MHGIKRFKKGNLKFTQQCKVCLTAWYNIHTLTLICRHSFYTEHRKVLISTAERRILIQFTIQTLFLCNIFFFKSKIEFSVLTSFIIHLEINHEISKHF